MTDLYLSRVHFPVTTLGPGRRLGIWFQGCSIRCPGCISVDTWATACGEIDLDFFFRGIRHWLDEADGVTLSGGEPFDQPEALEALLKKVGALFDGDVLVYTGYAIEEVTSTLDRLTGLIDAVVSDRYEADAADLLPLRGSDNQRLHRLTVKGRERFASYEELGGKSRALDMMIDADGNFWFAGIPRRQDFATLRALLEGQGHTALTTEYRKGSGR